MSINVSNLLLVDSSAPQRCLDRHGEPGASWSRCGDVVRVATRSVSCGQCQQPSSSHFLLLQSSPPSPFSPVQPTLVSSLSSTSCSSTTSHCSFLSVPSSSSSLLPTCELRIDLRSSLLRVLECLKHQHACSLSHHKPAPVGIEWPADSESNKAAAEEKERKKEQEMEKRRNE